jgi:hypothetical protein
MQPVAQLSTRLAEILQPLGFTNRLSNLSEVAGQRQLVMTAQDDSSDAASVNRIIFVLAVERPLAVGPQRVDNAPIAAAFC